MVLRTGARITKEIIMAHVRDNLPSHMNITGDIFFMDSIPHNPQPRERSSEGFSNSNTLT